MNEIRSNNCQIWLEVRRWKPEVDSHLASNSGLRIAKFTGTETLKCMFLTNETNKSPFFPLLISKK